MLQFKSNTVINDVELYSKFSPIAKDQNSIIINNLKSHLGAAIEKVIYSLQ